MCGGSDSDLYCLNFYVKWSFRAHLVFFSEHQHLFFSCSQRAERVCSSRRPPGEKAHRPASLFWGSAFLCSRFECFQLKISQVLRRALVTSPAPFYPANHIFWQWWWIHCILVSYRPCRAPRPPCFSGPPTFCFLLTRSMHTLSVKVMWLAY